MSDAQLGWRVAYTGGGDSGARRREIAEALAETVDAAGVIDVLDAFGIEDGAELVAHWENELDDDDGWAEPAPSVACRFARRRVQAAGLMAASGRCGLVLAVDPPAAAAFQAARRVPEGPRASVVGVVPSLAVHPAWLDADADVYAVAHDDVAAALRRCGVPGPRVQVTGIPALPTPPPSPGATRRGLGLMVDARVVLCVVREVGEELLDRLLLQLSLISGDWWFLFGSGGDPRYANLLREKVPIYGLHAKLFGGADADTFETFLCASDLVVGRASGWRALQCISAGSYLVGLSDGEPDAEERRVLEVLERHRAGSRATNVLQLAAEIDLAHATGVDALRERVEALARPDAANRLKALSREVIDLGERAWLRATVRPAGDDSRRDPASSPDRDRDHVHDRSADAGPRDGLLEDLSTGEITGARPPEPTSSPQASHGSSQAGHAASSAGEAAAGGPQGEEERIDAEQLLGEPPLVVAVRDARSSVTRWKSRLDLATRSGDASLAAVARTRLRSAQRRLTQLLRPGPSGRGRPAVRPAPPAARSVHDSETAPLDLPRRDERDPPEPQPPRPERAADTESPPEPLRPIHGLDEAQDASLRRRFDDLEANDALRRLRRRAREDGMEIPPAQEEEGGEAGSDDVGADGLTPEQRAERNRAIEEDLRQLRTRLQDDEPPEHGGGDEAA